MQSGRDVPDGFSECPTMGHEGVFFWEAFCELTCDRPIGMAAGPIPFTAIDRYAGRYGIVHIDEFQEFKAIIRALDAVALDRENDLEDEIVEEEQAAEREAALAATTTDQT